MAPPEWQNWAGTVRCQPTETIAPTTVSEISELVSRTAEAGSTIKCVGAGHSFSAAAATSGTLINLDDLTGIESIVPTRDANGQVNGANVTVWAGTRLYKLGPLLWELGLAQPNLGDFAEQSLAGAIATGTHGTGASFGGLPTTVVSLQIVTADGEIHTCSPEVEPDLFAAARLGIGAVGIVTKMTIHCVPAFGLHAKEYPSTLSTVLGELDQLMHTTDHVEFYWFPHTDTVSIKENTRISGDSDFEPIGRLRSALDDQLLSNEVFELVCRASARRPSIVRKVNPVIARALRGRTYSDRSYRVFASPRRVRFKEMEYAIPTAAAATVLRDLQRHLQTSDFVTPFPVEVRFAAADDVWLSTAYQRSVCYIAVHQFHEMDHSDYFAFAEQLFLAAGGRPHWGKMHTRTAEDLSEMVPRFGDFVKIRDLVDPDRIFANEYTEQVLP